MNMLRLGILCIVIVLFAAPLFAQKKKNDAVTPQEHKSPVWKRRVARLVDTRDTLDAKGHVHKNEYGDTVLAKLLIDAVMNDKIIPFETFDDLFSSRISKETIKYDLNPLPDTMVQASGDSFREVIQKNEFKSQDFTKYRILEEWVFDPFKRESEIHILGVALLKDIYDFEGYRGSRRIFWLKWKDVKQIVNEFMEGHQKNSLQRYIWDSYFKYPGLCVDSQSSFHLHAGIKWTERSIRSIELKDTLDWESSQLYNAYENWTIGQSFYDSIKKDRLSAYNDSVFFFKNILPFDSIGLKTQPDTIDEYDIATKILFFNLDWNWFYNYNLLEEWSFDPENGKTNIHLLGIEPRFDIQDIDTERMKPVLYKHMFWVRYQDVIDILDRYYEYHPLNNLSTSLWRSYFKE